MFAFVIKYTKYSSSNYGLGIEAAFCLYCKYQITSLFEFVVTYVSILLYSIKERYISLVLLLLAPGCSCCIQ